MIETELVYLSRAGGDVQQAGRAAQRSDQARPTRRRGDVGARGQEG